MYCKRMAVNVGLNDVVKIALMFSRNADEL